MITFERLRYAYPRQPRGAILDLSARVEAGCFLLITGPSGSGKSTVARSINGLVPHFYGGRFGGLVSVAGIDTRASSTALLSLRAGFVAQDPETQTVTDRVEDEIAFGLENRGLPSARIAPRVEEALDLLGIAPLRRREIATLSGGERQRVAIAAAMASRPEILVLDEPTSQLDPWGAEEVLTTVERLNSDLGTTIVLVEHRLDRVLPVAERVLLLAGDGGVQFDGPVQDALARLPEPPPLVVLGHAFGWSPPPLTVRDARRALRRLDRQLPSPPVAAPPAGGPVSVELEGVTFGYDDQPVLRDARLAFHSGTVTAIIGRNGSGKTTLLKQINGLLRPQAGTVRLFGEPTRDKAVRELAAQVAYLPQNPGAMLFNDSVEAELRFTLRCLGRESGEVASTLDRLGLRQLAGRHPFDLSGGERQRAALAAVLVGDPSILLLDEPTRGMDAARKRELARTLVDLARRDKTVILVTHDVELIAAVADRVVLLAEGQVIADGSPREILPGSLTFATQTNRVLGGTYLLPEDAIAG